MIFLLTKVNTKYKILKLHNSSVIKDTKIAYYLCVQHDKFIKPNIDLSQIQHFILYGTILIIWIRIS
jgi:hypothetical protein